MSKTDYVLSLFLNWASVFNKYSLWEQFFIAVIIGFSIQYWLTKVGISHNERLYTPQKSYPQLNLVVTFVIIIFCIVNIEYANLFFTEQGKPSWGIFVGMLIFIPVSRIYHNNNKDSDTDEVLLFNRELYVNRIVSYIKSAGSKSAQIAICGDYGAGKTTILNKVSNKLKESNYVVVRIDSWGVDSSAIGRYILREIINNLAERFDTSSFQSLPLDYQQAIKSSNSWLYAVFKSIVGQPKSVKDQLTKLDKILAQTNSQVLVIIEDIDRNPNSVEYCSALASILDKLKLLEQLHFIIASGYTKKTSEVLRKVCRYREDLISEDYSQYIDHLLLGWIDRSRLEGHYITPEYRLSSNIIKQQNSIFDLNSRSLLSSINNIISTPRVLGDVEASINKVWKKGKLLGEVDLVELLVITVIRDVYPEVFELLIKYERELNYGINTIPLLGKDESIIKENIVNSFRESLPSVAAFDDISCCLKAVFPRWSSIVEGSEYYKSNVSGQKIKSNVLNPNYFKRIVRKEIGENELFEQSFLMAFEKFTDDSEKLIPTSDEVVNQIICESCKMELFNRFSAQIWSSDGRHITSCVALKKFYVSLLNHYQIKYENGYQFLQEEYSATHDLFLKNLITYSSDIKTIASSKRSGKEKMVLNIICKLMRYDIYFASKVLIILDSEIKFRLKASLIKGFINSIRNLKIPLVKQNFYSTTLQIIMQEMSYQSGGINSVFEIDIKDWQLLIFVLLQRVKSEPLDKLRILNFFALLFTKSSESDDQQAEIYYKRLDALSDEIKLLLFELTSSVSVNYMKEECEEENLHYRLAYWHRNIADLK